MKIWAWLCFVFALRLSGNDIATYNCRLRPSGNHTATFAVNWIFFEHILDPSIGESM